jgi:hypothetical protein
MVIVVVLADLHLVPAEADGAGRGFLGDGFWGPVRGFSGRLRAAGYRNSIVTRRRSRIRG